MAAMLKRPIGVWFSVAILILILGGCLGYAGGIGVAHIGDYVQQRARGSLNAATQHHLRTVMSQLREMQFMEMFGAALATKTAAVSPPDIRALEKLRGKKELQDIRPVVDLRLGIAYVKWALSEEATNSRAGASEHLAMARSLFGSLGWKDCSDETMKQVVRKELDRWLRLDMKPSHK